MLPPPLVSTKASDVLFLALHCGDKMDKSFLFPPQNRFARAAAVQQRHVAGLGNFTQVFPQS
jgi:hypothetical protein